MRVTVRVFARLRELAGHGDWPETFDEAASPASVASVWRAVVRRHPELGPFERTISCAVNADFARMTTTVKDGDEIAFLPPVSGG